MARKAKMKAPKMTMASPVGPSLEGSTEDAQKRDEEYKVREDARRIEDYAELRKDAARHGKAVDHLRSKSDMLEELAGNDEGRKPKARAKARSAARKMNRA
jgi:hypothetical protein